MLGKENNKNDANYQLPRRQGEVTIQVPKVTMNIVVLGQQIFPLIMMRGKSTFNIELKFHIASSDTFSWIYLINVYHVINTSLNDKKSLFRENQVVFARF